MNSKNTMATRIVVGVMMVVGMFAIVPGAFAADLEDGWDYGFGYGGENFTPGTWENENFTPGYMEDQYFSSGNQQDEYFNPGYWENEQFTPGYMEDEYFTPGYMEDEYFTPGYQDDEYFTPGYTDDIYRPIYETGDYSSLYGSGSYGGGSYGGGYSTGGGYSFKPVAGYPTTIYQPTYNRPTPTTPTTPSNTTVVNNNTNTNTNVNNNTAIAVAQVQIGGQTTTQPNYPHYPTYPAPYCTISHTQYTAYNYGTKQIYLTWTSSNASSAYLSGHGSVGVNGSQTVYSAANQTYTLTVYGYNGQQATCQTTVYGTTYTPTPYVSLTQIPYTGFDFGPFGNAMYWAGLISVALAGAYLAVYYIPGVAFAGTTNRRAFAPVVAPKAPILAEKEAALEKLNPIVTAIRKAGTNDAMAIVKSLDGSMPKIVIERY